MLKLTVPVVIALAQCAVQVSEVGLFALGNLWFLSESEFLALRLSPVIINRFILGTCS
jgi:hypothetical protein